VPAATRHTEPRKDKAGRSRNRWVGVRRSLHHDGTEPPATKTLVSMTARTGVGVENIMDHSSCMTPQHNPHDTEKSVIRSSVGIRKSVRGAASRRQRQSWSSVATGPRPSRFATCPACA
jgi:hypothetical protein